MDTPTNKKAKVAAAFTKSTEALDLAFKWQNGDSRHFSLGSLTYQQAQISLSRLETENQALSHQIDGLQVYLSMEKSKISVLTEACSKKDKQIQHLEDTQQQWKAYAEHMYSMLYSQVEKAFTLTPGLQAHLLETLEEDHRGCVETIECDKDEGASETVTIEASDDQDSNGDDAHRDEIPYFCGTGGYGLVNGYVGLAEGHCTPEVDMSSENMGSPNLEEFYTPSLSSSPGYVTDEEDGE